ncbi:MAG: ribosome maturation factor RimP [Bacillota bacterium]
MNKLDEAFKTKIKDQVESLDYAFYDVHLETRQGDRVLSIEIDHKDGIDLDDCVKVSEHVSEFLDEADPFDDAYMLEVTSAGAEHPLRNAEEIERAIGRYVHIETFEQVLEGTLEQIDGASLVIKNGKKVSSILMADIQEIRLAIETKGGKKK